MDNKSDPHLMETLDLSHSEVDSDDSDSALASLVCALGALNELKAAQHEAISTINTSIAAMRHTPISQAQALVTLTRMAARLLPGAELQIIGRLTPQQCIELVRAGGTRSETLFGVVGIITLTVGDVALVVAETPEDGSPEAEAERKAFECYDRERFTPSGPAGSTALVAASLDVWKECRAEVRAMRSGAQAPDRIERIAEADDRHDYDWIQANDVSSDEMLLVALLNGAMKLET